MNELTTYRWSFEEDVLHFSQAGYDSIGVWRRKLADFGEERGVELLKESGLGVSNLLWAGGFTGNDGRSVSESVSDAAAAIDTAEFVGADCLVLYTGGRNNHTQRHAQRLVRGALDELLPRAERQGVTLAIEPMHPACGGEWTILYSLEETLDLLADYGHPRLKMVFDTYHFPVIGDGLSLLANLAPSIGVVHLGDRCSPHSIDQERCELGTGRTRLAEIIGTLLDGGYEGAFDVELLGVACEAADYPSLLRRSRESFAELLATCNAV